MSWEGHDVGQARLDIHDMGKLLDAFTKVLGHEAIAIAIAKLMHFKIDNAMIWFDGCRRICNRMSCDRGRSVIRIIGIVTNCAPANRRHKCTQGGR